MELWIRSQDKENLSKAEHLGVYNEKIYVNGYEDNGYCIGIYKTKERALEVLDEIQKLLEPQMILSKIGKPIAETCDGTVYTEPNEYEYKELLTQLYEMPEE